MASDRYCVDIKIGGEITEEGISELWPLVLNAMVGWGWDECYQESQVEEYVQYVRETAKDGIAFELYDSQGNHATFEEIAKFCQKAGLTYCIHEEAYGELAEDFKWWKPGMDEETDVLAAAGDPMLDVARIEKLLTLGDRELRIALTNIVTESKLPVIPALTIKE